MDQTYRTTGNQRNVIFVFSQAKKKKYEGIVMLDKINFYSSYDCDRPEMFDYWHKNST